MVPKAALAVPGWNSPKREPPLSRTCHIVPEISLPGPPWSEPGAERWNALDGHMCTHGTNDQVRLTPEN